MMASLTICLSRFAQELGPRFVLRLVSLQKGTFDSKGGEFEWEPKKEKTGSRRKFNL